MGVSLKDVAAYAGVSPATVSRVLNGHPHVSEEMRARVQEALESLNYDATRRSRQRQAQQQNVVALLIPHVTSPFYGEVLWGLQAAAFGHGFDLVVYLTESHPYSAVKERILATGLIAGVVVVTPRHGDEKSLLDLGKEVSLVVLDHRASGSSFPHVTVDNLRAGHEATRYLIQKGRRRIAMITGPMDIQSARERLSGYRLALEEANLPYDAELVRQGWFIHSSGYEQTQALLNRGKPYPDAIFCSNDLMAAGALQALKEAGLRVPEDVAVLGFDDLEMARTTQPPLTTMAQPIQTMGETAIRLLSRLIKGEEPDVRRVVLEAKLVVRQSA